MHHDDANPIYLTRYGSHAFGLATPESDLDLRGVFIPPRRYYLGFLKQIEHLEKQDGNVESFLFEIRKFFRLAAESNPSVLEILFTDEADVESITPLGERLRALGPSFLSRKIRRTFGGYAHQQLKRIRNHHRWLVDPPLKKAERGDFGLPEQPPISKVQLQAAESMIRKRMDEWAIDFGDTEAAVKIEIEMQVSRFLSEVASAVGLGDVGLGDVGLGDVGLGNASGDSEHLKYMAAAGSLGFDENFLQYLDRERHFRRALRQWRDYQTWLKNRNPARAELERKFGYDTKHAMHLVRLLRMAQEILTTGEVRVKRPDREELLAIRLHGAWSYEQLLEWAETTDAGLDELAASPSCPLPAQPDKEALNQACLEIITEAWQ